MKIKIGSTWQRRGGQKKKSEHCLSSGPPVIVRGQLEHTVFIAGRNARELYFVATRGQLEAFVTSHEPCFVAPRGEKSVCLLLIFGNVLGVVSGSFGISFEAPIEIYIHPDPKL
ncbi:hypothetical protein Adt_03672 [Abeliophyllum distichum]|uniref:Uncharacterized protein n=1 Tax=Abeliophyllum distichum TaxID=126358 RepID=A0ABD1VZ70_9LAMI